MNRKLIITTINTKVVTAVFENDSVAEIHCTDMENAKDYTLGDIYVGKIKNIVGNINAAFIEVANGVECYYSLDETAPIFTQKTGKKPYCIGDELLVQISKEAVKTKVPTVTGKLNLPGKYAVLTYGDNRIGVSSKIPKVQREHLQTLTEPFISEEYGFIIRTNAQSVSDETICNELERLKNEYEQILNIAKTRVCFSAIKKASAAYISELRNIYQDGLTEIIVEDDTLHQEVQEYLKRYQPEDLDKLRHYNDKNLPLHKLYSIEKHLLDALKEKVWLKSGAYLVIQPTEALTVIDVNTGKAVAKKKNDDTWLRINMEAAKEVVRQIRLRNISGIILVDFINMHQEKTKEVLSYLQKELKNDPIETILVDATKLQLVEITRKKIRKPLNETFHISDLEGYI